MIRKSKQAMQRDTMKTWQGVCRMLYVVLSCVALWCVVCCFAFAFAFGNKFGGQSALAGHVRLPGCLIREVARDPAGAAAFSSGLGPVITAADTVLCTDDLERQTAWKPKKLSDLNADYCICFKPNSHSLLFLCDLSLFRKVPGVCVLQIRSVSCDLTEAYIDTWVGTQ